MYPTGLGGWVGGWWRDGVGVAVCGGGVEGDVSAVGSQGYLPLWFPGPPDRPRLGI